MIKFYFTILFILKNKYLMIKINYLNNKNVHFIIQKVYSKKSSRWPQKNEISFFSLMNSFKRHENVSFGMYFLILEGPCKYFFSFDTSNLFKIMSNIRKYRSCMPRLFRRQPKILNTKIFSMGRNLINKLKIQHGSKWVSFRETIKNMDYWNQIMYLLLK